MASDDVAPIGWFVRVTLTTPNPLDPAYDTVIYLAGFADPAAALEAVRRARSTPGETFEVLPGEVTAGHGPQPERGEVRRLPGAV